MHQGLFIYPLRNHYLDNTYNLF